MPWQHNGKNYTPVKGAWCTFVTVAPLPQGHYQQNTRQNNQEYSHKLKCSQAHQKHILLFHFYEPQYFYHLIYNLVLPARQIHALHLYFKKNPDIPHILLLIFPLR